MAQLPNCYKREQGFAVTLDLPYQLPLTTYCALALQEEFQLLNGHGPKQLTSPDKHINLTAAPESEPNPLTESPDQDRCSSSLKTE